MAVLALRFAWMPAFVMEIVCCSMASWIATWSVASILSNSSMQQMPLSANIKAPASTPNSPVSLSRAIHAVNPAADAALPDVYTLLLRKVWTYFKNCDFAVEGSPTTQTLIVPRSLMPSCVCLATPPTNCRSMPCFISLWPNTAGAMLSARASYNLGRWRIFFAVSASFASRGVTMSSTPSNAPPADFNCLRASSASSSSLPLPSASSARSTPQAENSIL
mmetsp:Transcript_14544/g.42878  ORF Transcript_14544/g.42878 Transcript_14544/m.42878 type:complete len:220 (-) Transcript_14544:1140-1799(-)